MDDFDVLALFLIKNHNLNMHREEYGHLLPGLKMYRWMFAAQEKLTRTFTPQKKWKLGHLPPQLKLKIVYLPPTEMKDRIFASQCNVPLQFHQYLFSYQLEKTFENKVGQQMYFTKFTLLGKYSRFHFSREQMSYISFQLEGKCLTFHFS